MTENELMKRALEAALPDKQAIKAAALEAAQRPVRRRSNRWLPVVAGAACAALILGVMLPSAVDYAQNPQPETIVRRAAHYEDIYEKIEASLHRSDFNFRESAALGSSADGSASAQQETAGLCRDYSDTNNQVEGVQEGDVIKTDGQYLYTVSNPSDAAARLTITQATDGQLTLQSSTELPTKNVSELFLCGNRLVLIGSSWQTSDVPEDEITAYAALSSGSARTNVVMYDVSDPAAPVHTGPLLGQDGVYHTARVVEDRLYVLSEYVPPDTQSKQAADYVPRTYCDGQQTVSNAEDVYFCEDENQSSLMMAAYTTVTAYDLQTAAVSDTKSFLGFNGTTYVSDANLYLTASSSGTSQRGDESWTLTQTRVMRLEMSGGRLTVAATGSVPGTVSGAFWMDEYNGMLRIVTNTTAYPMRVLHGREVEIVSRRERTTGLYVLDKDLRVMGKLEELAPTEQVQSVRFMGDIAYFVTYRQTDPLFAVDLSYSFRPHLLSQLKIPGFSVYLHPYRSGRLLGIGYTDGKESIKLSMFNTEQLNDVTEQATLVLDGYFGAEVISNHKAALINSRKNLIAFEALRGGGTGSALSDYVIYGYSDEEGFVQKAAIPLGGQQGIVNRKTRGLFIDDFFYLYTTGRQSATITSYDLNDFTPVQSAQLR